MSLLARLGLSAVWLTAGLAKVSDPAESVRAVRAYQALPESLVPLVGHGLPFLEIAIGVLLLVGLLVRPAAVVAALLLVVFITGVSQAWARGLTIDCGCFGGGGTVAANQTKYLQEVLRDCGFLLLAGWLIARPASPASVDALLAVPPDDLAADLDDDDAGDEIQPDPSPTPENIA